MNVSIAMCTYNGAEYLEEQLDSIIVQLSEMDEIIISDDGSTDRTLEIIENYRLKYPLIHVFNGPHDGVFKNFENAILHCNNEIICLADQDDIWNDMKISCIKRWFHDNKVSLILHNGTKFNDDIVIGNITSYHSGFFTNLIKSSYYGCCMAFRKEYIDSYLPFGVKGITYDQLIGLLGEVDKVVKYYNYNLIRHRMHGDNWSQKKNFIQRIVNRIHLIIVYCKVTASRRK